MAKRRKRESLRAIEGEPILGREGVSSVPEFTIPRQYSLVRFRFDQVPAEYHSKYPFTSDRIYVFFGEISNMRGHCIVADHITGQVYSGFHTENFTEIAEDEA